MKKLHLIVFVLLIDGYLFGVTNNYCLTLNDDPATTMVVGWGGDQGVVYYGTEDFGQNYLAYAMSKSVDRTGNAHGHNRYFVRLTNLTPETVYYFVIRDESGAVSQRFKFKTLSDDPSKPLSYISGGDSRDGFKVLGFYVENCPSGDCTEMRREGNRLVAKLRPDFVAFNGDFVMNQVTSNTFEEWNRWFSDWQLTISSDGRMYPMIHTQGNHEDNLDTYQLFDVPIDEYYALSFHGNLMRMYLLNSERNACTDQEQLNWFINDLENHSETTASPFWKFVQYHIPTFGMANNYGLRPEQMTCWVNLFELFGVQMVSESHGHCTKWTLPCVANNDENDFEPHEDGVVYIGEGQWGAPHRDLDYDGASKKSYVRDQGTFDNFFYITVNQDSTVIRCVKFEQIDNITAHTSDELGKDLPMGTTIWSPENGDRIVLRNPYVTSSLSLKDAEKIALKAYPIPAQNELIVEFEEHQSGVVELYNSLGKLCIKESLNGMSIALDITNVCSGVSYLFVRSGDEKVSTIKIVKQ